MTDEPEVTSFDVEVEKAWTAFRDTLANRLEQLGDDENVILELDVPDPDGGRRPTSRSRASGAGAFGLRCPRMPTWRPSIG